MSDEKQSEAPPLSPVDLVPKKTIHQIISEDLYDKLRSRPLPNGDIEYYDPETNQARIIMHKYARLDEAMTYLFDEIQTQYGPVYLTQGSRTKSRGDDIKASISYSEKWSDLLCHELMEGKTLREISLQANMPPYQTIWTWRQRFPEFEQKVRAAYEARAEWLRDEAFDKSKEMLRAGSDEWQQVSKHIDHLMNFAAKDDPKKYSSKVEIHNTQAPVVVKLETGVRLNEELPEAMRAVKEITGENAQEIIKQLTKGNDEPKNN